MAYTTGILVSVAHRVLLLFLDDMLVHRELLGWAGHREGKESCLSSQHDELTWARSHTSRSGIRRANHLAPVVRRIGNAIPWINLYPVDSAVLFLTLIRRIAMDPIDSAIRPLNHRALATKLSLGVEAYYWGPMGGGGEGRGGERRGGELMIAGQSPTHPGRGLRV